MFTEETTEGKREASPNSMEIHQDHCLVTTVIETQKVKCSLYQLAVSVNKMKYFFHLIIITLSEMVFPGILINSLESLSQFFTHIGALKIFITNVLGYSLSKKKLHMELIRNKKKCQRF